MPTPLWVQRAILGLVLGRFIFLGNYPNTFCPRVDVIALTYPTEPSFASAQPPFLSQWERKGGAQRG